MSSKIVRGEAGKSAAPVPWATARSAPAPPSMIGPDRAGSSPIAEERDLEGRLRQAREAGLREGRADAETETTHRIQDAEKRLARAVAELAGYRARLRREAERDVVLLAIGIAQRILHRQIATDQGALQGLVKSALENLEVRELQKVRVHTSQAAALEMALREIGVPAGVEVIADAGLEPGGLVFETVRGSFDASVATQLDEIERGFADLVERRGR